MNWEFIVKYLPLYQKAAVLTLKIGIAGQTATYVAIADDLIRREGDGKTIGWIICIAL